MAATNPFSVGFNERNSGRTSTQKGDLSHSVVGRDRQEPDIEPGEFLSIKESEAGPLVRRMWEAMHEQMDYLIGQWRVNVLRRQGLPNVSLRKQAQGWDYYVPIGTTIDDVPTVNKIADTNRKLGAQIFNDPPASEPVPASTEMSDIEAARFAGRVLESIDEELQEQSKARRAFLRASDYGSGFVHYYIHPEGEFSPEVVMADANALSVADATENSLTGEPQPGPFEPRMARPDGALTSNMAEANQIRLPALRSEVLTGMAVRIFPLLSEDIWDSQGVIIGRFIAWGRLRQMYPEWADKLSEEEVEDILAYRPARADDLAAFGQDIHRRTENDDETLVWLMTIYFKDGPDYPFGAWGQVAAEGFLIERDEWYEETADGQKQPLPLPVTQYGQWDEGREGPYKVGTTELIGPAGELRNLYIASMLDHLDRLNNRKVFIPHGSGLTAEDMRDPNLRYLPTMGDAPQYEQIPPFPIQTTEMIMQTERDIDNTAGLGDTAQGLENPSVKSGRHALAIVQQAQASLSELVENVQRGWLYGARVKMALIRAHYEAPRIAEWAGPDEEYRVRFWSNSDLGNTTDVRMRPGALSLLSPAAKAQLAEHYFGLGILPPQRMQEIFRDNLGGTIGLSDDPHLMRIRRQIAQWLEGPPPGWQPNQGEVVNADGTGLQQKPDPAVEGIWAPVDADFLPQVAQVRVDEISKLMATRAYSEQPPGWNERVRLEFQQMVAAIQPPAEEPAKGGSQGQDAESLTGSQSEQPGNNQDGQADLTGETGGRPPSSA
jgi:hypothetical protein